MSKEKLQVKSLTDKTSEENVLQDRKWIEYSPDFQPLDKNLESLWNKYQDTNVNLSSLTWKENIAPEHLTHIERELNAHWGIKFAKRPLVDIPHVDPDILCSIVGRKNQAKAMKKLSIIRDYILIGQNPRGQAFDPFNGGKKDKIPWVQNMYDKYGEKAIVNSYQESQFRSNKMTAVSGAAQALSRVYCRYHPELVRKLEEVSVGIMKRINGITDPITNDEIRRPYWTLDKQEKIEVVDYVEKACIDILKFFSAEEPVEVFSAEDHAR